MRRTTHGRIRNFLPDGCFFIRSAETSQEKNKELPISTASIAQPRRSFAQIPDATNAAADLTHSP